MRYSAVFFDLDGTLLNTLGDLTSAVNYVLENMGFPARSTEEVRSFIGDGFAMLIKRACPDGVCLTDTEKAYSLFSEYYFSHLSDTTVPYDGIEKLVERLADEKYPLAVVSNKRDDAVKILTKQFFGEKIPVALGERGGDTRKPSPKLCFEAADVLSVPAEKVLYIGDSPSDIRTAHNAGMIPVGVTWGFRSREELSAAGDALLADTPEELMRIINDGIPEFKKCNNCS
jgi:phosphoglycolate phosphatase